MPAPSPFRADRWQFGWCNDFTAYGDARGFIQLEKGVIWAEIYDPETGSLVCRERLFDIIERGERYAEGSDILLYLDYSASPLAEVCYVTA